MKTGTCLRPSWTAIVCPTISGKIVDVRDQVRIICLLPDSFIRVMRLISRSSTNGPFFELLLNGFSYERSDVETSHGEKCAAFSPFILTPPSCADDQLVGFLVLAARPLAEGRHAPRGDRVAAALGLALAATVRVVDGVHRRAAHGRTLTPPAATARLAARDVLVVDVADLAHCRPAGERDAAHLARGQAQDAVALVLGDK